MPYYSWKARNREGRVLQGIMAAESLQDAGLELAGQFPHILQVRPVSPLRKLFLGGKGLSNLERETFFRKLGLLLQGGLPILRALRALEGHGSLGAAAFCRALERDLQRGMSLSQVLARQKRQAGDLAAPLAEAGENSGQLPFIFQQLALFYQKKRENQKTILQACLYPALVLCLALVITVCFCWWLLPLFGDLYASLGLQPGRGFQGLLAVQRFFQSQPLFLLLGGLALGGSLSFPLEMERTLAALLSPGIPAGPVLLGNPFLTAPGTAPAGRTALGSGPSPGCRDPAGRDFSDPGGQAGAGRPVWILPGRCSPTGTLAVQSLNGRIHGPGGRERPAAGPVDGSSPYPGPGFPEQAEEREDPFGTGPAGPVGRRLRQPHGPPLVPPV